MKPSLAPFKVSEGCWFYEESTYLDLRYEDRDSVGIRHIAIKLPYSQLLQSQILKSKVRKTSKGTK